MTIGIARTQDKEKFQCSKVFPGTKQGMKKGANKVILNLPNNIIKELITDTVGFIL